MAGVAEELTFVELYYSFFPWALYDQLTHFGYLLGRVDVVELELFGCPTLYTATT